MSWIVLTESDVLTVLSGPELASYRATALAAGQADPLQPSLDQITDLVRGHVAACPRNRLGSGDTIPQKLKSVALDLLAFRLPNRLNLPPGATRERLHEEAMRVLGQVAAGRFDIEIPTTPATEQGGVAKPRIVPRARCFTREEEEGI